MLHGNFLNTFERFENEVKLWTPSGQPGVFVPVTMLATEVQAARDQAVKSVVWEVFSQGCYAV